MKKNPQLIPTHIVCCRGSLVGCNSFLMPALIAACLLIFCAIGAAQTPDTVAQREIQRRQTAIPAGEAALAQGKAAMKAKNYTLANQEFRTAVTYLPDAVVSGKAHDEAVEGFCKSGVILAEARIAQGDYAGAEAILSEILSDRYDPNCREAQQLLAHLRQPGYFNKTMGPKFIAKVEEVKQLLTEADGFYKYGVEAYDEARARNLWEVEKGWEEPVREYGKTVGPETGAFAREVSGTARITNKLNTIIIPRVEFRDASIREAIDFLREQAVENDPSPEGKK